MKSFALSALLAAPMGKIKAQDVEPVDNSAEIAAGNGLRCNPSYHDNLIYEDPSTVSDSDANASLEACYAYAKEYAYNQYIYEENGDYYDYCFQAVVYAAMDENTPETVEC